MPRIRTIKPEFFSSPGVEGMSMAARLLYIAMWNWADDYGRGTANPKELAGFAFPHDADITSKEIPWFLKEVAAGFDMIFYEVDGRRYYAIPSWEKHQRTERRAQPQHPGPDEGTQYQPWSDALGKLPDEDSSVGTSESMQGNSASTQGSSGPGTGEQGNRGTGEEGSLSSASQRSSPRSEPERFAEFYDAFPRHKDRKAAAKAFTAAIKTGVEPDTLITGARRYRAEVAGKDPQYVKHPKTWLNQGCWNDEPDPQPMSTRDRRVWEAQRLRSSPPGEQPRGFPQLEVISA